MEDLYEHEYLNQLQQELDHSAVISDKFKSYLMQMARLVAREAYRRGKEEMRKAGKDRR